MKANQQTTHRMRVARYYNRNDIRMETAPVPEISENDVLVKVVKAGICGSDLSDWYMEPRAPMYFGHEVAGDIVEKGRNVTDFEVGDRVFAHHHVPCFVCHHCARGHYTMCPTYKETELDPGAFAEYVRVPALNLERDTLKLPESVGYEEGALIEPIACALKGMKRVDMHPGDTVVIFGAGFAGAIHIELARLFGARRIFVVDRVPFRLRKALEVGATDTIDLTQHDVGEAIREKNDGRLADVVVLASGSLAALDQAFASAGKGASINLFAPYEPQQTFALPLNRFFFEETLLVASYSSSPYDTRAVLSMIEGGQLDLKPLITHDYPLDEIAEAFQTARAAQDSLKIELTP